MMFEAGAVILALGFLIRQARCLHFGTSENYFGSLGAPWGPKEQQKAHLGVQNANFNDVGCSILGSLPSLWSNIGVCVSMFVSKFFFW